MRIGIAWPWEVASSDFAPKPRNDDTNSPSPLHSAVYSPCSALVHLDSNLLPAAAAAADTPILCTTESDV